MNASFRSRLVSSAVLLVAFACERPPEGPNVLFVVWDTVRADRMSLYGYERPTTPQLDLWARNARVFDDCRSTAGITVSSHAAMFTGMLPTETGASNEHQWLDEGLDTLAEILRDAGWRTYAWSANPHLSEEENFTQGFGVVEHPWDDATREEALAIVREKVRGDDSSELGSRVRGDGVSGWSLKAAGALAAPGLSAFLERGDPDRPWFAFVNWMEAHRPLIPPRKLRRAFLSKADVERSYAIDVSWDALWAHTFGLEDIPAEDLEVLGGVYDAAVSELDQLFAGLLEELEAAGHLENTIVVLTSDHGEHLGEHHMLDHQFSLHRPLLDVPLVLAGPGIEPGREERPVANHDLFPTILELTGVRAPVPMASGAQSLLAPSAERLRLAEYPAPFTKAFKIGRRFEGWDAAPWKRSLVSITDGRRTLLAGSDGWRALYPVEDETRELSATEPDARAGLEAKLDAWKNELRARERDVVPEADAEHRDMLEGLGYAASGDS